MAGIPSFRRRGAAVAGAILVSFALVAGPAAGALPRRGATYKGTVAGKVVTLKISKKSRRKAKYTYDCGDSGGPVGAWTRVRIKADGSFSGRTSAGYGGDVDSLKGRFKSSRRARARFRLTICDEKGGKLTLKRVK